MKMRLCTLLLITTLSCVAQTITGVSFPGSGSSLNHTSIGHRTTIHRQMAETSQPKPNVVVFIGDRVFPQFVDGGGWSTSIYLVNLENHPTQFSVLFFKDDGTDLYVPVVGQGPVRGMMITLDVAGSIEFQTAGSSSVVSQGWALISQTNTDSIGAMAIFRYAAAGLQTQEAVVPITNQFDDHFVLMFDNTATFVTGIAIANPTSNAVVIPVNIRDQSGRIIDTRTTALGPYGHAAFILGQTWPSTAGIRGAIEFLTSGFGVAALGLRFNGLAFTSFPVFENYNWTLAQP